MHLMQILRAIYVIVPPFVCLLVLVICHIYIYQQRNHSEPFTDLSPQEDEEPSPDVSTDEPMPAASTNTVPRIIMYYPDTFAPWPSCVHRDDGQYMRYLRSKSEDIRLKLSPDQTYEIIGTSGRYKTSLRSCTCPDFGKNQHGGAPCKHIYFLARHCNIDVDAIFEDYHKYGRYDDDKVHSEYRR